MHFCADHGKQNIKREQAGEQAGRTFHIIKSASESRLIALMQVSERSKRIVYASGGVPAKLTPAWAYLLVCQ